MSTKLTVNKNLPSNHISVFSVFDPAASERGRNEVFGFTAVDLPFVNKSTAVWGRAPQFAPPQVFRLDTRLSS
jgi:hypothetical protein